ncbi:MAG TPA: hypothetical protein VFC24_14235 [Casimicrobiaceae bacterium]|nr:hypothetical protein [Casimicrobiaceae bacterium]
MRLVMTRVLLVLLNACALALLSVMPVAAKPFLPAADDVVLERLPEKIDPSLAELKRLRLALSRRPGDLDLATRFARRAIEASRETGDPRFLGQAQAVLATWWDRSDAPREILVLRATIRQSLHDFPAALADLDRVLQGNAQDAQARLTRASILTVIGRYDDALRDCNALARLASEIVVVTCRAGAQSLAGDASAYRVLVDAIGRAGRAPPAIMVWAHTLAAEIAARTGDADAAEQHFRRALALDARDAYLRGAYADFLIDRQRPREAIALIGNDLANDALLLRVALAESRIDAPTAEERQLFREHRADLAARFAASRARGDIVHRREEARYALHLEHDVPRALALARANWDVQREAADLRILAESARAAGDASALELVRAWSQKHAALDMARNGERP